MKKTCCFGFLVVLMTFGCARQPPVAAAIRSRIQLCAKDRPCVISMRDVTRFDWDICYAFEYGTTRAVREAVLHTADPSYSEFEPQLVFLKSGRIVYEESHPTDVEHPLRNEIVFDIPEGAAFRAYRRDARFTAEEILGGVERYYLMRQIPSTGS
jgi:hypothetical protein